MIGRLNHVAIAVPDLAAAAKLYSDALGAQVSSPVPHPDHGVTVVFVSLPNAKIELLESLGKNSPIAAFLERNHYNVEIVNLAYRMLQDPRFDVLEEVLSVNIEGDALNSCLQRLLTAQTEPGDDLRQLAGE